MKWSAQRMGIDVQPSGAITPSVTTRKKVRVYSYGFQVFECRFNTTHLYWSSRNRILLKPKEWVFLTVHNRCCSLSFTSKLVHSQVVKDQIQVSSHALCKEQSKTSDSQRQVAKYKGSHTKETCIALRNGLQFLPKGNSFILIVFSVLHYLQVIGLRNIQVLHTSRCKGQ